MLMYIQIKKTVLCLAVMMLSLWSFATTRYVATTGSDSNTGTIGSPWLTISKANSTAVSGDSVLFRRGDTFTGTGQFVAGVKIGTYGSGANPIFTGLQTVSFTNIGGNIWQSNATYDPGVGNNVNIVTVGGVATAKGRYPNTTYGGYTASTSNSITVAGGPALRIGSEILIRYNRYTLDVVDTTSIVGAVINYNHASSGESKINGFGYFYQNGLACLDINGEWHFDKATGRLYLFYTTTPPAVQIATINRAVIAASNQSYTNISFIGYNQDAIYDSSTTNVAITGCLIQHIGWNGVYQRHTTNTVITGTTIRDINNNAIHVVDCVSGTVTNNTILNIGMQPGMIQHRGNGQAYLPMRAIAFECHDGGAFVCDGNYIYNTGSNGIHWQGYNISIRRNKIEYHNSVIDDGGGIYTYNGSGNSNTYITANRVIDHNIVMNGQHPVAGANATDPETYGIYLDGNSHNATVTNNVSAYNIGGSGFLGNQNRNIIFTGNTFYDNNETQVKWNMDSRIALSAGIISKKNIYCAKNISDLCYKHDTWTTAPDSSFVADSNWFARPIGDPKTLYLYSYATDAPFNNRFITLATYKGLYGTLEQHSKVSPKSITSTDSLRFEVNTTSSPVTIPLGAKYITLDSTVVTSVTIPADSSIVLIYSAPSGGNIPPTAVAVKAGDRTNPTDTVTLFGSGSDPDGTIVSYAWVKLSGPICTINSPSSATTLISSMPAGTYVFQLTVTDNNGATGVATVTVTVNQPVPVCFTTPRTVGNITVYQPNCQAVYVALAVKKKYNWTCGGLRGSVMNAGKNPVSISTLPKGTYIFRINNVNFTVIRA